MKKTLIGILALFSLNTFSQIELDLVQKLNLKHDCDNFGVDQFGNIYLIKGDELLKLDSKGKELYAFSDPLYGNITSVDALNAMNPLVFYDDVNQLRILDNRLNDVLSFDLLEAGFIDPTLVAYSDQENIWFYDQILDRLARFEPTQNKITDQSLVIAQINNKQIRPIALLSSFNRVLLVIPNVGIMVFDPQGSYVKTIALPDFEFLAFSNKTIIALNRNGLISEYTLDTDKINHGILNLEKPKAAQLINNRLYVLDQKVILIYTIKN